MPGWPKISVVVPSFNQGRYLGATLDSVLEQSYPALEVIVMDGGSTDGSVDVIREREAKLSYWVSGPDGGQSEALVRGFQRSTGDIQCWLNSDDLFAPGALHHVGAMFRDRPGVEAVYGDAAWIDPDGRELRVQREMPFSRFIWLYTYNYIPQSSMFWRRELYDRVGGIDASFDLAMDADLWARFADHTELVHTRRVLSRIRFHLDQKTQIASREKRDAERQRVVARYIGAPSAMESATRRAVARVMRVGWRAATGCYRLDYRPDLRKLLRRNHG